MTGYPSNSESVAQSQLRAFVERILRMKEEARAVKDDIREIYAEAKANGFDKTVLGQVVGYVEKRQKDPDTLAERSALFDLYLSAHDGTQQGDDEDGAETGTVNALTHTHEAPQSTAAGTDRLGLKVIPAAEAEPDRTLAGSEVSIPSAGGQAEPGAGTQAPPVDTIIEQPVLNDACLNALKLRPHCLAAKANTLTKCGGHGKITCAACLQAHADAEGFSP